MDNPLECDFLDLLLEHGMDGENVLRTVSDSRHSIFCLDTAVDTLSEAKKREPDFRKTDNEKDQRGKSHIVDFYCIIRSSASVLCRSCLQQI